MKGRKLSGGVSAEYYEIQTGSGPLHVHIDYDDKGPYRVFANLPPLGSELSGLASVVSILVSKLLEAGGDVKKIIKHLNSIKGDRPYGLGPKRVDSIPHAIAIALRTHLQKTGKLDVSIPASEPVAETPVVVENVLYCPKCHSNNYVKESGCATCHDCGHSECS